MKAAHFFLPACFFLVDCLYFQFRVPRNVQMRTLARPLRIASVGFHPYDMVGTGMHVSKYGQAVIHYEPSMNDKLSMAGRLPFARPVDEFEVTASKIVVRIYDSNLRFAKEFRRESGYYRVNRRGPAEGPWQPPLTSVGGHPVDVKALEAELQEFHSEAVDFFNAAP